jgi:ribosomal protein S18 acetylase RimI-like enzyme
MTLTLRRYRPEDAEAVWDLHVTALAAVDALAPPGPHDADLQAIESVYLDGRGEFLVGTVGDRPVAMGALRAHPSGSAELKRMRVHPDHQGRGFGRAVLEALEARAAELGYTRVVLDTTPKQAAAIALYRKTGYTLLEERAIRGWNALVFEKRLAEG